MSERETRGANEAIDFNDELRNRREKLAALRQQGVAFPNDFRRDHTSDQLHEEFDAKDNQELESLNIEVSVAGRMMVWRFPMIFAATIPLTSCTKSLMRRITRNWNP